MIQKVLKKILLWLFDSGGNNEVFAKVINDTENEIIQKIEVMKANEAPEKIYIPRLISDGKLIHEWNDVPFKKFRFFFDKEIAENIEYIRSDAFIEKACDWFRRIDYDDNIPPFETTEEFIEGFKKAMKL